jgi:uncharacterized protein
MSSRPFTILSFDGGGIRGLFSAAVVSHIEQYSGKWLVDHFDLLTGTSTGAIIALGLAAGLSGEEILRFYEGQGQKIFARPRGKVACFWKPKYDNAALIDALQEVFGDRRMNDLVIPVCIPSYELREGCPRVVKTDHVPGLHWGGNQLVWKVAAASSAAPIYLPAVTIERVDEHIDGGIWANNPVMVGITEAIRSFGKTLDEVAVLSVGTGSKVPRRADSKIKSGGARSWLRDPSIIEVVMVAQSQAVHGMANLILPAHRYLRVDTDLSASIPLDSYAKAVPLIERGFQAGRLSMGKIQSVFLSDTAKWRPANFPVTT